MATGHHRDDRQRAERGGTHERGREAEGLHGRVAVGQAATSEPHRHGAGSMCILWIYGSTHVTRTFAETGETLVQQVTDP